MRVVSPGAFPKFSSCENTNDRFIHFSMLLFISTPVFLSSLPYILHPNSTNPHPNSTCVQHMRRPSAFVGKKFFLMYSTSRRRYCVVTPGIGTADLPRPAIYKSLSHSLQALQGCSIAMNITYAGAMVPPDRLTHFPTFRVLFQILMLPDSVPWYSCGSWKRIRTLSIVHR
ncbi:hypothetical protein HBI42_188600 [Parastagonospora nodorum]|nr:hypothetical protein HBI12_186330 [Parastagonospora nodorum]KAH6080655.1 hypothetical protein HBI66_068890 [Parastagonospora nodorum]KAH6083779.1 hypothetical protein HBI67_028620 [Parastagonospora nodorum]KAH6203520.1 hypothetical protein HBI43_208330 [Parastagonospora nodorum]KAH6246386.1 hypothetical protein HBI42_188600 [Parastagonospora nodorum]